MSISVMVDVWRHSQARSNDLLLLLAIADHARDDGLCWPSIAALADKTRVSESTVKRSIKALVDLGELKIETAGGTFHAGNDTKRLANRYRVIRGKRPYKGEKLQRGDGVQNEPGVPADSLPNGVPPGVQNEPGTGFSNERGAGFTAMDPGRGSQLCTPNHHKKPSKETTTTPRVRAQAKAIQPLAEEVVVVSSLEASEGKPQLTAEELDMIAGEFRLNRLQIEEVRSLARSHGLGYIEEKIAIVESEPRRNKAAVLMKALREDWQPPAASKEIEEEREAARQREERRKREQARLKAEEEAQAAKAQADNAAAKARHDLQAKMWAEASLEQRQRWVSQAHSLYRHRFVIDGPPPNPFLLAALRNAMFPGSAEQSPEQAAA